MLHDMGRKFNLRYFLGKNITFNSWIDMKMIRLLVGGLFDKRFLISYMFNIFRTY